MEKPVGNPGTIKKSTAFSHIASALSAVALTLLRLPQAGRMHVSVRRLNGMTDGELAARGRTRRGEVDRIFG